MKKFVFIFIGFIIVFIYCAGYQQIYAQTTPVPTPQYEPCGCPAIQKPDGTTYTKEELSCVDNYTDWSADKTKNFWVKDAEVTALGKGGERARQFLFWTLTHRSVDNQASLLSIWGISKDITYFLLVLVAAVMGLGIIIGKKYNFSTKIQITPLITKIVVAFLYATFSAAIVLLIIQISDILMLFFTEKLGVTQLFNIFFLSDTTGRTIQDSETAYQTFQGCINLNINLLESAKTSKLLINITNSTYYLIGIMMILRKVILWLLLFVSPFLAILFSFAFIKNIGWIWVGVFFQWIFYGPLFALFLGAVARIWSSPAHIPFIFDFSRSNELNGFIYPTAINILYGGPAQQLSYFNTSNYVDTFAEYIIALIMLWAVVFFPWWLLRIFRDYCCDGIIATKNILMSMYDQMRGGTPPTPSGPLSSNPIASTIGTALKMPREIEIPIRVKMETIEEIRKVKTEDITKSLSLQANKLTDIARFETNHQSQETVRRNLDFLTNPTKATTPTERQKYMNIRTELFNRAVKEDHIAKQILSTISTSKTEQFARREEFIKTTPQITPVTQSVSVKVNISQQKVSSLNSSLINTISNNSNAISNIAQTTNVSTPQVQTVLSSYKQNIHQNPTEIVQNIVKETGVQKEKVIAVIKHIAIVVKTNKAVVKEVAQKENVKEEEVEKVVAAQTPIVAEPEKHIEQVVSIPPTISIEDYEEVKKMWIQQYEKGEVPVTENITSRQEWVEQDTVFITNTLNKLVSPDNKLRQEGMDDLGYILPIFLINNLKGEELVVYLKAKLEAAKAIKESIEKEKEITTRLKAKTEEVLVDVEKPKAKEAEKTMEMRQELEIKDNKTVSS